MLSNYLVFFMNIRHNEIMMVTQDIKNITDAIREAVPVEKIYLFGSYAYGQPEVDSDYDFYIIIPDEGMRPINAMQEARRAILPLRLNMPIDVLANTNSNFEKMKNRINCVAKEVAQRGILLYERHGVGSQVAQ